MNGSRLSCIVTCEHGGSRVPARYRSRFEGQGALLRSHRAWDRGALDLARRLARALGAPLFFSTVSRQLVDLNRSLGHPRLFGSAVRSLPASERERILERHYLPHRTAVEDAITRSLKRHRTRPVLHLAIHSFTPVLDGVERTADLGLLYDPARHLEAGLCARLVPLLRASAPSLRIRRNYPYLGKADGFTTALRKRFPPASYAGVEIEVNQRLAGPRDLPRVERALSAALQALLRAAERPLGADGITERVR